MAVRALPAILLLGAIFGVTTGTPSVDSFTVSDDLSRATMTVGGRLMSLPLHFTDSPERQVIQEGPFTIEYYPPALYESLDSPMPGTVLLVSDMPYRPEVNEVVTGTNEFDTPSRPWGAELPQSVEALYDAFDTLNDPSIGTLCDEERPGPWTFRQMTAQRCFVWCTGYARMTADLLRASGQPARLINMGGFSDTLDSGILVQSSESHTTVERWDGERWVWIGPTFRVREATLDGRALSVQEVIVALSEGRDVSFTRWIDGEWVTSSEQDAAFRASLTRYFTGDKELSAAR